MGNGTTDIFLTKPAAGDVEIARASRVEWAAYEGRYTSKAAALESILADHIEHVGNIVLELDPGMGAVLITEIADTDLALIDVHFPSVGERFLTVFPRKGSELVVKMLERNMRRAD